MNALLTTESSAILERVLAVGDLAQLTPSERNQYYNAVCRSTGLNPLTRPFEYVKLSGKLVLYARRDAADQLRKLNGVSLRIVRQETIQDLFVVTVEAKDANNRVDTDLGAVAISGLRGEALANAMLKACTKAKRRVTLSICGLGLPDESELPDVPGGQRQEWSETPHDPATGEVFDEPAEAGTAEEVRQPRGPWAVNDDRGEEQHIAATLDDALRRYGEVKAARSDKLAVAVNNLGLLRTAAAAAGNGLRKKIENEIAAAEAYLREDEAAAETGEPTLEEMASPA
jgi:hypothetical protein